MLIAFSSPAFGQGEGTVPYDPTEPLDAETQQWVTIAINYIEGIDPAEGARLRQMLANGQIVNVRKREKDGTHDGNTIAINCDIIKGAAGLGRAILILMHEYDHMIHSDGQDGHTDPRTNPTTLDGTGHPQGILPAALAHAQVAEQAADDLCSMSCSFAGLGCEEIKEAYLRAQQMYEAAGDQDSAGRMGQKRLQIKLHDSDCCCIDGWGGPV